MPKPSVRVHPVIHVATLEQTRANLAIAEAAGADSCFLINHEVSPAELVRIARSVSGETALRVGMNVLGATALEAMRSAIAAGLWALWSDDPGIGEPGGSSASTSFDAVLRLIPSRLAISLLLKPSAAIALASAHSNALRTSSAASRSRWSSSSRLPSRPARSAAHFSIPRSCALLGSRRHVNPD